MLLEHAHRTGFRLSRHLISLTLLAAVALACNFPSRVSQQSIAAAATLTPPPIPTSLPLTATPTDTPTPTLTSTATLTPTATATATETPTFTPPPTNTPTNTPVPTLAPTIDPNATATPIPPTITPTSVPNPPPSTDNLFENPGFEGSTRSVIFPEVNVFTSWEPFYCDQPYTKQKCPALRRDTKSPPRTGYNDPSLVMGRPEYKPSDVENRVRNGKTAQQWFCFFRVCDAGVFQTIDTHAGQTCEASAYVQSWSASGSYGTDGKAFTSDTATKDDKANSVFRIRVDTSGGTQAFANGILVSRDFTYDDGHYDKYAKISYTFTAAGDKTTIFFENVRLWPFAHNDSYIDDAAVFCN